MEEQTKQEQITPIEATDILLPIRQSWKKILIKEKDVIADKSIVGPSKSFNDVAFPFAVTMASPDHMVIIFRLNAKKERLSDSKLMACCISRDNWRKDLIKK
jgi:hypothetical protein